MTDDYPAPPEETAEDYLTLLDHMRLVVRAEQMSEWERLRTLDEIITLASDSAVAATEFADKVALGLIRPESSE